MPQVRTSVPGPKKMAKPDDRSSYIDLQSHIIVPKRTPEFGKAEGRTADPSATLRSG